MTHDTTSQAYAQRLERLEGARWKRLLDVQRPYRWNVRRLDLGRTLDVGCGIGRNLVALPQASLGVDHNASSVATARERGLDAITSAEFDDRYPEPPAQPEFEGILLAHVLEHMTREEALGLLRHYLPHATSKVAVICPQEKGYTTDSTHVTFLDGVDIAGDARGGRAARAQRPVVSLPACGRQPVRLQRDGRAGRPAVTTKPSRSPRVGTVKRSQAQMVHY